MTDKEILNEVKRRIITKLRVLDRDEQSISSPNLIMFCSGQQRAFRDTLEWIEDCTQDQSVNIE